MAPDKLEFLYGTFIQGFYDISSLSVSLCRLHNGAVLPKSVGDSVKEVWHQALHGHAIEPRVLSELDLLTVINHGYDESVEEGLDF